MPDSVVQGNDPINVMLISSSYPRSEDDWKSIFVSQMLGSLADKSHVKMVYWGPPGKLPENVTYACLPDESAWLDRLMEEGGLAHLLRNGGIRRFTAPIKFLVLLYRSCRRQKRIDIYHVNWLQNVLSLWGKGQPALVTVLGSDLGFLRVPGMVTLLRSILKNKHCILAPNADWMVEKLEHSFGDVAQIIPIPLGIDDDWFALYAKRQRVTPDQWLVVARLTQKKVGPLFKWGRDVFSDETGRELHLFGPMQEEIVIPEWVHYHGPTFPDELKEKWFPTATGLITTSHHDEGRPQVMLEAMAAGLPILASNITAHSNFITHQQTGYLVNSQEEFNTGIQYLSLSENYNSIAGKAHEWVKKEVGTWSDCAGRYCNEYEKLISNM